MTTKQILTYSTFLLVLGIGWGFTQPMTKIAVSEGYGHFGLIFWQLVIGAALMAVICAVRGYALSVRREHLRLYVIIALIGTILPNSFSYQAAVHLPAGIISLLFSMIPILSFPIALALRLDQFQWLRLMGLVVGMVAVLLIVLPGQSISGAMPLLWVGAVLLTCGFYAFEGNFVARWGTYGLDAVQVLYGASLVGVFLTAPLALATGQWIDPRFPWGAPDYALIASSVAHVLVYSGYVWLVGRAGPVFTAQVSYLVTLSGIVWAKIILQEEYSAVIWVSLALMMLGMYLVRPRANDRVAE